MIVYQAYINWPAGEETIGIFSTPEKAEAYWSENYEGKSFMQGAKYTHSMLHLEEYEVDRGTGPYLS